MSGTIQTAISEVQSRDEYQSSAKFFANRIEESLCDRFPMELVRDSYFDATFYAERDPYREFDVSNAIDLMEADGTKVQIKGCLEWTKTASGRRRGRYRLWLPDHVRLVEDDAVYLFVVYDPTLPKPIQKTRFVRARDLERVTGRVTWMDATHSTKRGKPANVVHTRVFPGGDA